MLFILNRQEKVINILKNYGNNSSLSPYFDDSLVEMLNTGAETFSFSTVAQGNLFKDLVVGNYVAFKKGQKYKLFQIVQVETRHDSEMIISVYCECAGLDLINKLFRARKINSCSLRKFIDTITEETGWNTGIIDATLLKTFDLDLEDDTVYATLQNNISKFEGEIEFRVELKNGQISNKFIDVYANRGKVTGKRFVFGKDIEGITRTVDSTSLYTALKGVGKNSLSFKGIEIEGIDKPVGQDFVADQEAYEKYNNNGYHIIGLFEYDTESPEELLRETYKQLQKVKEPKVTYEIPIALLAELLGKDWEKVNIGDTVSIFDNAFNPPLMLMARVSQLETSETNPYANNCTFTNFIEVSSNITDEMRKLASKLEGYVDNNIQSKFPIGSEDIQEGAVNGSHIYQNSITTDHLSAESITAEKIMAGEIKAEHIQADAIESKHIKANQIDAEHIKADSIESSHIKADQIESDHIKANQINANHIESNSISAKHVQADSIKSHHISSNQIETTHLKAEIIESGHIKADQIDATHIKADAINSNHIQSESIKTEHLQAGSITAASGIIAEGAIGAAQINSVNANVIDTGELNTSKIKIKGENGFLFIENNTLFVVDENRQIRCELGVIEKGTNYGFIVRGADGQTILLDHNGVKNAGITDGAVDNRTVSENANISGKKLDIDSVIRTINEDGSVKIQGTTVQVGNTTLDVKLSEQTNLINDHTTKLETQQSEINANTESIKLKVDNQTYTQDKQNMTSQLEKNTSSIEVLQKEISLKVEETDITTAVSAAKEQLSKEIKAVNDRVDDILEDVSGAIADGIIDEAESLIIKNSLDQLNREKAELTQRYNYIYANTNLKGTIKNNLKSAYDDFVSKHTVLVNIINTIISDKKISVEEKQNYNNSLQNYSDALSLLNKRFDEAIESFSSEKIISAKAEIKITTDAISQNISKLENTVSEKADGSVVTEMSQKMSTLETSVNGINGKVSSLETTTSTHTTELSKVDGKIKDAKDSAISTAASDATSKAAQAFSDAKNYVNGEIATIDEKIETTKSQVAEINIELESITQRVQKTESTTATLTGKVDKSIKNVDVLYAISSSSTTAPTTGWQSTPPTWVNGEFIWSKTTTVLTDGTSTTTDPVCITGATGATGATGQGVESITEEYYLSTSKTTQTGGSWTTTPPTWSKGKYIWTRSKIVYKNPNSTVYTTPVCDTAWEAVNDVDVKVEETKTQVAEIVTDLNSITTRVSSTETNITNVTNNLNNMAIANRNEWLWSNFEGKQPNRITFQNGGEVVDLPSDNPTGFSKAFHSTGTSSRVHLSWKPSFTANGLGKKFLFSCWVKYSNVVQGTESFNVLNMFKHNLKYKLSDNTETSTNYITPGSFTGTSDWKKVTFEYTYTKSDAVSMLTNLWIGLESSISGEFWVTGIQVCEGNKLGAWTQAPEDFGTEIGGVYDHVTEVQRSVINSYESALEVAKENISLSVSQMYAKKDDVSSIEQSLSSKIDQTAKDISLTFNKTTDEVKNDLQGFREEITAYIRFDADGMELGKSGSKFKTRLTNEKLAFLQDNEEVAYVSNNKMNITDAEIKNQLTLGSFAFIPRSNGNLSLKWIK